MVPAICSAAPPRVSIAAAAGDGTLGVSWVSESVTRAAPYWHYDCQLQTSANLVDWADSGGPVPGGLMTESELPHAVTVPAGIGTGFVRLAYRLNAPGADLHGADLAGADLRGADLSAADLAGANLSGANLVGANITGANLAGAAITGANLDGVNLDGRNLGDFDLRNTLGTPVLTHLTVPDPDSLAADALPRFPYRPKADTWSACDAEVPGLAVAKDTAMVMLKDGVTAGQLNACLAQFGAAIVGSGPRDDTLGRGFLVLRLPTASALELLNLTQALALQPIVEAAAPDLLLGQSVVSDDDNLADGWFWAANDDPMVTAGGNWGLEWARVPQLWNLVAALGKSGAQRPRTGILDSKFFDHADITYSARYGPASLYNGFVGPINPADNSADHGVHVAGIVGANFDNGTGIDGVNPFADIVEMALEEQPVPLVQALLTPDIRAPSAALMVENLRDFLAAEPGLRVLNTSLGFNWRIALATRDSNGKIISYPALLTDWQSARIWWIASSWGKVMAEIASSNDHVLFVTAAGNDYELVPAAQNSPMADAALEYNAANIAVVEAFGKDGNKAGFSNTAEGPNVLSAPGVHILSASFLNGYAYKDGTSMATPFVTGVAGFLQTIQPSLTPPEVIQLLKEGVTPGTKNVDAFASAMRIDGMVGDQRVLQMLLDIDDGSDDGILRVEPRLPVVGWDRTFTPAQGEAFNADEKGDGQIDMADFRRWRDWLYIGEAGGEGVAAAPNALDGNPASVKFDTNGEGHHRPGEETTFYPRGDFNGDSRMDRTSTRKVPGAMADADLTDLRVLIDSGLWDDPEVTDPEVLEALVDSADLWVSSANFFAANADLGISSAVIGVYAKDSTTPMVVPGGAGWIAYKWLGSLAPQFEFTVPIGQTYFVSSEPLEVPGSGGEKVLLRSISEQPLGNSRRGADLVIDLTCLQMTAKARAEQGPDKHKDIANADVSLEPVAADVTGEGGSSPEPGSHASLHPDGSTLAQADAALVTGFDSEQPATFTSEVIWRRAFIKNQAFAAPKFHIYPLKLVLGGTLPDGGDLRAEAEIIIEKRRGSEPWTEVVRLAAAGSGNFPDGFQKDSETLNDPLHTLKPAPTPKDLTDGSYTQDEFSGTFPIDDVPDNASFEVRYRLKAVAYGTGGDNIALAEIADPFEYGEGVSFGYGSFGSLSGVQSVINGDVTFFAHEPFYYVLERIETDGRHTPVDMMLGFEGEATMTDPAPQAGATPDSYFIRNIPLDRPQDGDGDGIDDVYELQHADFLDPQDPADASLDWDNDGFTNLAEYQNGTDPEVPDQPTRPPALYAGVLIPAEFGEHLRVIDFNGDGHLDLLSLLGDQIIVAKGNPDGYWQNALHSSISVTYGVTPADWVLGDFNADGKLDVVLADFSGQRLLRLDGLGDGHFGNETIIDLGDRPELLVLSDVTGDGRPDILVGLRNYKLRTLVGLAGGGFQAAATDLDFISVPTGAAVGRFDNDAFSDLAVTLANHKVGVYHGNGDGTFLAPGIQYGTGFSPQDVATGDVNGDGNTDLVTVNYTVSSNTRDLSLFLGNGDGTFQAEVRRDLGVRSGDVELVELNGDSFADVIFSDRTSRGYTVLPGGAGGLGAETPVCAGSAEGVVVGDWNGDGAKDLFSTAGDSVLISPGDGSGGFLSRMDVDASDSYPGRVAAVALVEAAGDASPELAILRNESSYSDTTSTLAVWDSPITVGAGSGPRLVVEVGVEAKSVACGDFNGDGHADYAVASGLNYFDDGVNELKLLLGNQDGTGTTPGNSYPLPERPVKVLAGDLNGDGRADLVVTLESGLCLPFLSSGGGVFAAGTQVTPGSSSGAALLVDVNGDGRAELCAAAAPSSGAPYLKVMSFGEAGTWSELFSVPTTDDLTAIDFADVGGGGPELLAAGYDRLDAYPRSGATFGSKRAVIADDPTFNGACFAVADADADGHPDIATLTGVHLALAIGGFAPVQPYWLGNNPRTVAAADMNGDGKPDIVSLTDTGVAVLPHL